MSIFKFLFDNELAQRGDIESLMESSGDQGQRVERLADRAADHERRIRQLEADVSRITLLNQALIRLLLEHNVVDENALMQTMRAIDLEDGVEDQRITPSVDRSLCTGCGRRLPTPRTHCVYCGASAAIRP